MCKDCNTGYAPNTSKTGCIVKSNNNNFIENEYKIINVSFNFIICDILILLIKN